MVCFLTDKIQQLFQFLNLAFNMFLLIFGQTGFTLITVELLKNIYDSWENSQDAIEVFSNSSKVFDCVDHTILIWKWETRKNLLISYLNVRIQMDTIKGTISIGAVVTTDVPQGSMFGPFLFLIYIEDLPSFVRENHETVLFVNHFILQGYCLPWHFFVCWLFGGWHFTFIQTENII